MKSKITSHCLAIGALSLLFTTQGFGMSSSEAAYFKRQCIKAGGRVGTRDGEYVCAGASIKIPTGKTSLMKKTKGSKHKKMLSKPKEMAY